MFEAYLGICVLPSETWVCDTNNNQEKLNTGELIKSYLDFTSEPLELSETLDSSYSQETISNNDNNSMTSNSINQEFITEINDVPPNEIIENQSNEMSIEQNNNPKFKKKLIDNNIILFNYFITNYIIRNNDENKEIETIKNETKSEIEEKQKLKIDHFNPSTNRSMNKSTEMNIFKKNQDNIEINFQKTEIDSLLKKNQCKTIGNIADPISASHYYLCYSYNGKPTNLSSVRMMCPQNLIFCAEKNICTRKRMCRKNVSNV